MYLCEPCTNRWCNAVSQCNSTRYLLSIYLLNVANPNFIRFTLLIHYVIYLSYFVRFDAGIVAFQFSFRVIK